MALKYSLNSLANPKVKTEEVLYYFNFGTSSSPEWELEGRGVEGWTETTNESVENTTDVLGLVDSEATASQTTQEFTVSWRANNKFIQTVINARITGDRSALNAIDVMRVYRAVDIDGEDATYCAARVDKRCLIGIPEHAGAAGSYWGFTATINYSNDLQTGKVLKAEKNNPTFIPDVSEGDDSEEEEEEEQGNS